MNRCPYKFFSLTNMATQGQDMQCIFEEGHDGFHRYREVLPPPQTRPIEGWVKMQTTEEKEGSSI